ncbi:hypothetical protein J5N97_028627 [Dioscorea zingiberensis]|uniref:Endonuclease/exonuclease/phosphatase domain-containing protein n=1 Tax=Dioscorea zingiberensis TaxID=325984 RepID=A0A9D5BZI3_9LILI|nr:hypothetical protein J5N97_028627 [Dioscorea zingiberensis]
MDSIKLLCWNCRGSSSPKIVGRIKDLMKTHHPDIVCLVETRADEQRAIKFCEKFTRMWHWAALPARGMSGGIITLWKQRVGQVTPISYSHYSLHLIISALKPEEWILSVIYNPLNIHLQRTVWHDLSNISTLNLPWVLVGDFNSILHPGEHKGGNPDYYSIKSRHFSDFISQNQLFDLGFYGTPFTWCNNQRGLARRWARLDRFLANNEWINNFEVLTNKHLPRTSSDHSPMLLNSKFFAFSMKRIFRFENFWFEYDTCHKSVCKAWTNRVNTSPMHAFSHSLSSTRAHLVKWKASGKTHLEKAIENCERDISGLEILEGSSNYSDIESIALRSLYNKHNALLRHNSIRWAQRAKLLWLNNGDYNTKFFQKHAKVRGHRNKISGIIDDFGILQTEHQNIGKVFCDFYTKLWSPSNNSSP